MVSNQQTETNRSTQGEAPTPVEVTANPADARTAAANPPPGTPASNRLCAVGPLLPEDIPRDFSEPTPAVLERVEEGLRDLFLARTRQRPDGSPYTPAPREPVRDAAAKGRVGIYMGNVGPRYQLRPLGGGVEWEAEPGSVEPLSQTELLSLRAAPGERPT